MITAFEFTTYHQNNAQPKNSTTISTSPHADMHTGKKYEASRFCFSRRSRPELRACEAVAVCASACSMRERRHTCSRPDDRPRSRVEAAETSRALSAAQISVLHLSAITNMKNQKTRDQDLCKHFNPSISQDARLACGIRAGIMGEGVSEALRNMVEQEDAMGACAEVT